MSGTIQYLEIVWTAIATFGWLAAYHNLSEGFKDYWWARKNGVYNGRRIAAKWTLSVEASRIIIQTIFIGIGVIAMTYPAAPPVPDEELKQTIFRLLFQWGLITASTLLALNCVVTAWARHKLSLGRNGYHVKEGDNQ